MKQKQTGFTIIELLAVIAIMGLFGSYVIANFAGQRASRDHKIAQNELITNIRKYQAYTLSGRATPNGNPPKYYILRFNVCTIAPCTYVVQAIDSTQTNTITNIQTITLPSKVTIPSLALQQPVGALAYQSDCLQLAFSVPFGRLYVDPTCSFQILYTNPATLAGMANSIGEVSIKRDSNNFSSILTNGVTGAVSAQQDSIYCPIWICAPPPPPPPGGGGDDI